MLMYTDLLRVTHRILHHVDVVDFSYLILYLKIIYFQYLSFAGIVSGRLCMCNWCIYVE